jgi:hypothetical protein
MQRLGHREDWISYCQLFGNDVRDPSKHVPEFCLGFVQACQAGLIQDMIDQELKARNYINLDENNAPTCEI